jgi:drug/metabolite transporter (DMT)-like permease
VSKAEAKLQAPLVADLGALATCSLIWGTTWRAIKLQLGVVPALDSVVYRFALAAALLAVWRLARGESLALTRRQHLEALGQGASLFCLQYGLVYVAEQTVSSGAMAVIFAATPFVNLILFRIALARRAAPLAWVASLLGLMGVAAMSASEVAVAGAGKGVMLALIGVVAATFGNLFAARAQAAGAPVGPATAWAMGYGSALLAAWQLIHGVPWRFEPSLSYVGSLLYLALFGSVIAFVAFYGLARRRGYTFASYIAALTPPTAMIISALTEGTHWGPEAVVGLALVLAGQVLLIRASRA